MVGGVFHLKPEVGLITRENGGVVLDTDPLKVFRVNKSAFDLLQKARDGLWAKKDLSDIEEAGGDQTLRFLDMLCQSGILVWTPDNDYLPFVSVIVPVYNRAGEIVACLDSLSGLDYPRDRLEIIVVDDGSTDSTPQAVGRYPVRLIVLGENHGQSAARNIGVRASGGQVVAFIDSDCTAEPSWLKELAPFFQDPRTGIVGGLVDSYYGETWLDRYEQVHSALYMGAKRLIGSTRASDIYVPSCNMLIKKQAYLEAGGLDEDRRVGEDVDLCWRLKDKGYRIYYLPQGRIKHKHRNRFWPAFKRRFEYGTSEPGLYARHQGVMKRFPWQPGALAFILILCAFLIMRSPWLLGPAVLAPLADARFKRKAVKQKSGLDLPYGLVATATLKAYFHLAYSLGYYACRYYLILIGPAALIFPQIIWLALTIALLPGLVDYFSTRPKLPFFVFLFYYWTEHAFYQAGVLAAGLKLKSLRSHWLTFSRIGVLKRTMER